MLKASMRTILHSLLLVFFVSVVVPTQLSAKKSDDEVLFGICSDTWFFISSMLVITGIYGCALSVYLDDLEAKEKSVTTLKDFSSLDENIKGSLTNIQSQALMQNNVIAENKLENKIQESLADSAKGNKAKSGLTYKEILISIPFC